MTLQIRPFRSLRSPSPLWAIGSQHAPYYIYARMHARGRNIPNNIYAVCIPFSVGQFHASALLRIQSLILLCTDGKTSSSPHKHRPQTAHALRNHPRLMSQRDTRNKVLHAQKPISSQTYSRTNSLNPPVFVRFSA